MPRINSFPAWGLTEYEIPLTNYPIEMNMAWKPWLVKFMNCSAEKCQELLDKKHGHSSQILSEVNSHIMSHKLKSLYVYNGTPYWRMQSAYNSDRFITLPPYLEPEQVHAKTIQLGLKSNSFLCEFLALYGAMCQQSPRSGINFASLKINGNIELELASEDFNAGLDLLSLPERIQRQKTFKRWWSGMQILKGGDGEYWHLGVDGSICWHECGSPEVGGIYSSIEEFIYCFIQASTKEVLFEGGYFGEKILERMKVNE